MHADTRRGLREYFRSAQRIRLASSDNPRPSDPWPRPAAGKVAPLRSDHPVGVRAPENVLDPPAPGPTARRVTIIVRRPCTRRSSDEYCRSCREPKKDWALSPESPSTAPAPGDSRPFVHTDRPPLPSLLPTWHSPDSHDPATRALPRIDPRGCKLQPTPAAHIHTRDDPALPTRPGRLRDHARRAGCILLPARRSRTDFLDTEIARAPEGEGRCSNRPAAQSTHTHNRCTARGPPPLAQPGHSIP